ncbi:G patch domain-containing protein 1 [Pelodytes ibericus]
MAAQESDGEVEDFVSYGKPLEQYEEGEKLKRPIPLQEQTVKDEKGRYKRFHGAFMGGFSAGYFNTVGSKEGWAPSTFVSSRAGRSEKQHSRPEDFMDEEDLGEFGIAPTEILTTDDFASKTKDRIRDKARELASVSAPIPGATILEDLIAPAKISIGVQLLRQMGWKEGQGVGPRTKRKARKQKLGSNIFFLFPFWEAGGKVYGCVLPPTGSEESEDESDEYLPENVTFAPKDVTPVDFTVKDNVHGLGYRGLDPRQALFGAVDMQFSLFGDGSVKTDSLLGDVRHGKGRKVGISGQAFGVGALEDDDDDIYGTESMSKYDTVLQEESGDGLFGWTAPKEYKSKKGLHRELQYIGKILDGFCIAADSTPAKKIYQPPDLPRDYRPVHHFRPVLTPNTLSSPALQAMLDSSQKPSSQTTEMPQSRHQLNSSQRREILGETPLQGPTSVLDILSDKDRERIRDVKQAVEQQKIKAQALAQEALKNRFLSASAEDTPSKIPSELLGRELIPVQSGEFRPFERNPDKQKRYEQYIRSLHEGQKDGLESHVDSSMTEWERGREREEFMRSAMLYKPSNPMLSSRFTRAKHEDDSETVEVPRDEESDVNDKASAVKMKMFGKLTRDKFEWHPDKLLCKRFNIPDPYPGSTILGLPKVKRDKFSVFNFLTVPEPPKPIAAPVKSEPLKQATERKPRKTSRWDVSASEEKDSVSEYLSQARSEIYVKKEALDMTKKADPDSAASAPPDKAPADQTAEDEETRPSIDVFKAIFADSSDDKSSSSEEEESDEEEEARPAPGPKPEAPSSSIQDPAPAVDADPDPTQTGLPDVKQCQESMEVEEEFGPRLPPVLASSAPGKSDTAQLPAADKVKKQKRSKEKRKSKKHKKEKKKKHKKPKHKNKHRSKAVEVSTSDTSSDSQSDSERTAELTPKELLKRLRNLPIIR